MLDALIVADHAIREWIVGHRVAWLDPVMLGISGVAFNGVVWIMVAAVLAWRQRRTATLVAVAIAVLGAGLLNDRVLKHVVHRDRPYLASDAAPVIGPKPHDSSFPSGHTAGSVAGAVVLSVYAPEARVAWWAAAIAVAYSRLYLGVHYPLDVLGGAAVGLVGAAMALLLLRWYPALAGERRRLT